MIVANYDGLTYPKEHLQNIRSSLELVIYDNYAMYKILHMIFKGAVEAWYNNLEPSSVASFSDLCAKIMACLSTNIPTKKSFIELFGINKAKDESIKAYLKRFNEEMFKVEDLIESVASKVFILGEGKKPYEGSYIPY